MKIVPLQAEHHQVQAEWVLHHQFLRIQEKTEADAPASERRYDAVWFIGYDEVSERCVAHLIDIFGARYSEALGYGSRDGSAIRFVFEYPDGPFHTTYRYSLQDDSWQWLLEQKDKAGKWSPLRTSSLLAPRKVDQRSDSGCNSSAKNRPQYSSKLRFGSRATSSG